VEALKLRGRDSEIRQILADTAAGRLSVLTYPPGSGASTLVHLGLAPAFEAAGFVALEFRDWQGRSFGHALRSHIAEAVRKATRKEFRLDVEPLDELLERARAACGKEFVLLLDQFEDYLRCQTGTDLSDAFDAELSNAIAARAAHFVIILQDYAVDAFNRFGQYVPNLLGWQLQMEGLTANDAREIARDMAEERRFTIEDEAVEQLIAAPVAISNARINAYLFARGVTRLLDSELRLKSAVARAATIEANGGADRLILESLDAKLGELNPTHNDLLFRWCNILISPEMHRLSVTEQALFEYSGKLNRFALTLLPLLQNEGVMRSVAIGDVVRYEIARDSLTPVLADWHKRREIAYLARRRAMFRVRSLSVATGFIVLAYVVWIVLSWKH
jgi:hypothetical protein